MVKLEIAIATDGIVQLDQYWILDAYHHRCSIVLPSVSRCLLLYRASSATISNGLPMDNNDDRPYMNVDCQSRVIDISITITTAQFRSLPGISEDCRRCSG